MKKAEAHDPSLNSLDHQTIRRERGDRRERKDEHKKWGVGRQCESMRDLLRFQGTVSPEKVLVFMVFSNNN